MFLYFNVNQIVGTWWADSYFVFFVACTWCKKKQKHLRTAAVQCSHVHRMKYFNMIIRRVTSSYFCSHCPVNSSITITQWEWKNPNKKRTGLRVHASSFSLTWVESILFISSDRSSCGWRRTGSRPIMCERQTTPLELTIQWQQACVKINYSICCIYCMYFWKS